MDRINPFYAVSPLVIFLFICFLGVSMIACTPKLTSPGTSLVLLPDEDGKTGQVIVTNEKGTQVVNESGYAVNVSASDDRPSEPFKVTDREIKQQFEPALTNMPNASTIFTLYFFTNQTELIDASKLILKDIVSTIHSTPNPRVGIIGHTDRSGNKPFNYKLALQRAVAIKRQLIEMGVARKTIAEVTTHGENNPAVWTEDGVSEPKNRRVEVVIR